MQGNPCNKKKYSIFMTGKEAYNSVQMKFKNHISYNMIKNLSTGFWKNFHDSRCSHMYKKI